MCGVAGFVSLTNSPQMECGHLNQVLDQLNHRGKDGSGIWKSIFQWGTIGLGHNRLSIIDLDPRSNQPYLTQSSRFVLSYNGEIYNYRELRAELKALGCKFVTNSDTEVLAVAWEKWGYDCIPKLNGMFAFALFDVENQILYLVRDRYGIKPLYFSRSEDSFLFASEPRAVANLSGKMRVNQEKLYQYLTMGLYDFNSETFFEEVFTLEPGHFAKVEIVEKRIQIDIKKWYLEESHSNLDLCFEDAVNYVRELFIKAVDLHLRSDVPIAVALSGGVDSTGIVGAIRNLYPNLELHTFSYESPGFYKDESKWARLASEELKTLHHSVTVDESDAYRSLKTVISEQGEPTNSSSVIAQSLLYRSVVNSGFKVILDGQGADELFAGYNGFLEFRLRSLIDKQKYFESLKLIQRWRSWSPNHSVRNLIPALAATYFSGELANLGARFIDRNPLPSWVYKKKIEEFGISPSVPKLVGYPLVKGNGGRYLQKHLFDSLHGGDLRRLLRHGDRSSMSNTVESRLPYLENELVRFVNSLPEKFLVSSQGETKFILRKALDGIIPDSILNRRDKIGFITPETEWLQNFEFSEKDFLSAFASFSWIDSIRLFETYKRSSSSLKWRILNSYLWVTSHV